MKDALNCGSCGYVCDTGYCEHGTCNTIPCTPNKCEEGIKPCVVDSTCFCFNTITGLGFCGENVGCAEAKDCYDDGDCPNAYVCAWDTCCGNNVCVLGNCPNPAAKLIRSVQRKRDSLIGDTAAYMADWEVFLCSWVGAGRWNLQSGNFFQVSFAHSSLLYLLNYHLESWSIIK